MTRTPEELRAELNGLAQRVRDDSRLTEAAKTANIAKLYLKAKSEMAGLEASAATNKARATDRQMRAAFGLNGTDAATVASGRAARSQLDSIDLTDRYAEGKVADMLKTATQLGDNPLRQAIALKAHQVGWGDVVQQWSADATPAQLEALNSLRQPEAFNAVKLLEFALPAPLECAGVRNDYQLQQLVDADPDPVATAQAATR